MHQHDDVLSERRSMMLAQLRFAHVRFIGTGE